MAANWVSFVSLGGNRSSTLVVGGNGCWCVGVELESNGSGVSSVVAMARFDDDDGRGVKPHRQARLLSVSSRVEDLAYATAELARWDQVGGSHLKKIQTDVARAQSVWHGGKVSQDANM